MMAVAYMACAPLTRMQLHCKKRAAAAVRLQPDLCTLLWWAAVMQSRQGAAVVGGCGGRLW